MEHLRSDIDMVNGARIYVEEEKDDDAMLQNIVGQINMASCRGAVAALLRSDEDGKLKELHRIMLALYTSIMNHDGGDDYLANVFFGGFQDEIQENLNGIYAAHLRTQPGSLRDLAKTIFKDLRRLGRFLKATTAPHDTIHLYAQATSGDAAINAYELHDMRFLHKYMSKLDAFATDLNKKADEIQRLQHEYPSAERKYVK